MRVAFVPLLLVVSILPAFPGAAADWGEHYGSLYRGCGPGGLLDVALVASCPYPYHGGWLEQGGCTGETCSLELWHSAHGWANTARAMELRSYLVVGLADVELCEASGTTTDLRCDIRGAVSFPLSQGCSDVVMRTDARDDDDGLLFARSEAFFLLCRESDQVWMGPSVAYQWVGRIGWGCPEFAITLAGCFQGTGGLFGARACDATTCELAGAVWGVAETNGFAGPKAVTVELISDAGAELVCSSVDVGSFAVCGDDVSVSVPLAPGTCAALELRSAFAYASPTGVNEFLVPFVACRFVDQEWIEIHNA